MAYKNQIDRFDIERGDVLSLAREDVARLADYWECSHPVLCNLFKWFLGAGEDAVKMKDPRDDRELRGLIEHQKKNAARRYDYLVAQRERKLGKVKTTDNHGQPRTQVEEQYKPKNSVSVSSSALYGDASVTPSDGNSTPSALPSSAVIGSGISKDDIVAARSTLARYAPEPKFVLAFDPTSRYEMDGLYDNCFKCCDEKQRLKCKEAGAKGKCGNAECDNFEYLVDARALTASDSLTRYVAPDGTCRTNEKYKDKDGRFKETSFWYDYSQYNYKSLNEDWQWLYEDMGEPYSNQTRDALIAKSDTLGETFDRAVWTFHIQKRAGQLPDRDKDGNATNYGKLLFGRLKKLVEARAIIDQADATRPRLPPPPTPPKK